MTKPTHTLTTLICTGALALGGVGTAIACTGAGGDSSGTYPGEQTTTTDTTTTTSDSTSATTAGSRAKARAKARACAPRARSHRSS